VDPARAAALYAPFRPRRGRRVGYPLLVLAVGTFVVLAFALPGEATAADTAMFLAFALLFGLVMHRFLAVRALPSPDGLLVVNLLTRRRLEWAEIVDVRFGGGDPWVVLDLDDGDVLPVMGVQRADGAFGVAESRRLATLVALHSRTPRDD
jgi:hypothetical protein